MQERSAALDRLVLSLTGKPVPRICFLPTASGDPARAGDPLLRALLLAGRASRASCRCSTSAATGSIPPSTCCAQDAIYVGGGSMRNMLAIWREHGVDAAMREAWERGVVLAGLSAGAMCWFEGGDHEERRRARAGRRPRAAARQPVGAPRR